MQKLELLAPAQNLNCAIAAINCGADALYIGAYDFGARCNAKNSIENIKKVVDYAHIFNVKVYVTLNTILNDDELEECEKLIHKLYEIKVDAIIIQDFGILNLALFNKIPPIVLHMSTQCDNRTLGKIKFFEEIGIKRVILARELSLEEIEKIRKNTSLELEHFISGALCVSYSGQCYMSHYIGKRSANRGECAQACRKKYSLVDKNGKFLAKNKYLLSLKDNNLSSHLDKLINVGVMSFKIEGRLKDENYVKNQTLYFHNLLKNYPRTSFGEIYSDFTPDISKTFNRGFCDDYLFNKKDNIYNFSTPKSLGKFIGVVQSVNDNNFCIKTKKDIEINPQDGLCAIINEELEGCLVNRVEKIKDGFKIFPNKKINIKKFDEIFRNSDTAFNKTLEQSKTKRKLDVEIVIYEDEIVIYDINKNKETISIKEFEKAKNFEKMKENFIKSLSKTNETPFIVKNIRFETQNLKFIPVSKLNEIRNILCDKLKLKILSRYKVKKQKQLDIAVFSETTGDYRLNIHNKKAKEFYSLCGCDVVEESFESQKNPKNKHLMITKHCLKKIFIGCDKKIEDKSLFLLDEKGVKFPLSFDCKNCNMIINTP